MLVDGEWVGAWQPVQAKDEKGGFVRQVSSFRNWVTPDGAPGPTGEGGFRAEPGRYRLYVALICPWASRTLVARAVKRLADVVPVTILAPLATDQGWRFGGFPGAQDDPLHGAAYLHQLYTHADPRYTGRATVPVLWDEARDTIVNNESADIVRMLNASFAAFAPETIDLYPEDLRGEIDALEAWLYDGFNNGVYRAGFATTQEAYLEAQEAVFATLERLEARLGAGGPFLFGDRFTEADIRLFVTAVRFDAAYHGLFRTNRRRLADHPAVSAHMARVLALPGVRETVDVEHVVAGYYSIKALNPSGIRPTIPEHVLRLLAA